MFDDRPNDEIIDIIMATLDTLKGRVADLEYENGERETRIEELETELEEERENHSVRDM